MDFKIKLHEVGKNYNGHPVFHNISGIFGPGKSYVVAGPNGSGKSTLLRIICGLLRPSAGEVRVEVNGALLDQTHNRGQFMGYLSPYINLYDRLTAHENLSFFAALRGIALKEEDLAELLDRVRLKPFLHRRLGAFSSGMQQRMKLAYALLHRPPVLLLDEPSTSLDDEGKKMLAAVIATQRKLGTAIIATNEGEEVEKYGEEIIHLDNRIESAGVEGSAGRV